ncbi:MAG: hypothetical protein IT539_13130 [Bradyrhizobiaceae bacterium]|nr:hypothetical protein [Bradyrhizobiaceae bacterium]
MNLQIPHHVHELEQLSQRMFVMFARCEYALKAAGFREGSDNEPRACWAAFAQSLENALSDASPPELRDAIAYILANPPRKQVVRGGVLEWATVEPESRSKADLILLYVRRVRNNLFHGGKFNGKWFDPPRSEKLLRASLTILEACIEASNKVREAYEN